MSEWPVEFKVYPNRMFVIRYGPLRVFAPTHLIPRVGLALLDSLDGTAVAGDEVSTEINNGEVYLDVQGHYVIVPIGEIVALVRKMTGWIRDGEELAFPNT